MRIVWLMVFASWIAAAPALAERVLVMSGPERAGELGSALEVALASRRVSVASTSPPAGLLRLDRAAAAQRAAVTLRADAALWIDHELGGPEVCAVSADGRHFRHAPLPADETSPRVFAAIAASLVDEMLAPPEPPLSIDVDVRVNVTGAVAAPAVTASAVLPPHDELAPPSVHEVGRPLHSGRTLIEAGGSVSTVALALEGALLFPVSQRWRAGVTVAFGVGLPITPALSATRPGDESPHDEPFAAGLIEVRRSGLGRHHWDLGGFAGAITLFGDGAFIAGARISRAWQGDYVNTQLALSPAIVVGDWAHIVVPAVFVTLRMGIAL